MRAVARCRAILVVGLIACRVIPEQEEGRVDTASAHADTQTIDLAAPPRQPAAIADALTSLAERVRPCERCFNLAEEPLCAVCRDPRRDQTVICAVEEASDAAAVVIEEKAGAVCAVADAVAILELGRLVWAGSADELDDRRLADLHLGRLSA